MDRTELNHFKVHCRNSPITIEFLKANQTKYNYLNNSIIQLICNNPNLTNQVFQWLISNYPDFILNSQYYYQMYDLPMEKLIIVIDHVIKIRGNLYVGISAEPVLHCVFASKSFDTTILNYLWNRDPQLDIMYEDSRGYSPLYYAIISSSRLLELLTVIKSYKPVNYNIPNKFKCKYACGRIQLRLVVNIYAKESNQSTIHALIEFCGELFPLIKPEYLTQDICNRFYSSKYFHGSHVAFGECNPDQKYLIKLIPKQFRFNLRDVNSHGHKTKPALRNQLE
jgi:hypothetical protein